MGITDGSDLNARYFGFDDEDIECVFDKVFKDRIGKELLIKKLKEKLRY